MMPCTEFIIVFSVIVMAAVALVALCFHLASHIPPMIPMPPIPPMAGQGAMLAYMCQQAQLLTDRLAMHRDEFLRIKVLAKPSPFDARMSEIAGICTRAISDIERTVPVVVECERLHAEAKRLRAALHEVLPYLDHLPISLHEDIKALAGKETP